MSILYQKENSLDRLNFSEILACLTALWTWEGVKHLSTKTNEEEKKAIVPSQLSAMVETDYIMDKVNVRLTKMTFKYGY